MEVVNNMVKHMDCSRVSECSGYRFHPCLLLHVLAVHSVDDTCTISHFSFQSFSFGNQHFVAQVLRGES